MVLLSKLIRAHTDADGPQTDCVPPLSIFGHADPVGNDEYNKLLGGRRAAAIYGLVTRRHEVWEDLYSNTGIFAGAAAGDRWGAEAVQTMLSEVGFPAGEDGASAGQPGNAIRAFQQQQGLPADGDAGPATRKQLFLAYMDRVCVNERGDPFRVDKVKGFLARNADHEGKGDFQGCGEFNPILIFSEQKNANFENAPDKGPRDEANAPNRRVMALLFRPNTQVNAAKWPCPRAKEGGGGCRKRFWSDGEQRRNSRLPDVDRKYESTGDTFACRFYERVTHTSPCEGVLPVWNVRLFDASAKVMANTPYRLHIAGDTREGLSDAQGWIRERAVQPGQCLLEWGAYHADPTSKILMYQIELYVDFENASQDEQDERRLHNLGYGRDCTFEEGVAHFQNDNGLPVSGELDAETSQKLKIVHDTCDPRPKRVATAASIPAFDG